MNRSTLLARAAAVLLLPSLLACTVSRAPDPGAAQPSAPTSAAPVATVGSPGTAAAAPGGTVFGASFQRQRGERYPVALGRVEAALDLRLVRVFYPGLPDPWPGKAPGRDVVVSFKIDPAEVLDGVHDDYMREWFREAPTDQSVHWVYWHEPENDTEDGSFEPEEFRDAYAHVAALADEVGRDDLRATVVLMSYSLDPDSGREWQDWFPPAESVDVLAWDVYNRGRGETFYAEPAELFGPLREASESVGKPYAVAEFASPLAPGDDGEERARWITASGCYLAATDAEFAAWFDFVWNDGADDYRLADAPSLTAWRGLNEISGGDQTCDES